jgi:uncharacterized membrane protein YbhN (UPF0104 family)
MRTIYRFVGSILLAAAVTWCLIALRKDVSSVSFVTLWHSWDVLIGVGGLSLLNYMLRVLRWQLYLRKMGYQLPTTFVSLTYVAGFALSLTPAKVGELARARYYLPWGMSACDLGAAWMVERLMDLIGALLLASLVSAAFPGARRLVLITASISAVCLIMLGALRWRAINIWLGNSGWSPKVSKMIGRVTKTLASAATLLRVGPLSYGFSLGFIAWLAEGIGLSFLGSMFAPWHLNVLVAVGIFAIAEIAGALSFVPGGLGTTEAAMSAMLVMQRYSITHAVLMSLAYRFLTLWLAVVLGWAAIVELRRREHGISASHPLEVGSLESPTRRV